MLINAVFSTLSLPTFLAFKPYGILLRVKNSSLCACLLLALMCGLLPDTAQAQFNTIENNEKSLEIAQTIMDISSYARWPYTFSKLQICVVGNAQYAEVLRHGALSEASYRVRLQPSPFNSLTSFADCQLVYIGALDDAERKELFVQLVGQPILSISEPSVPCATGSMFCLKFYREQLVFDINLDVVARSGLRVHPNVLKLAKRKELLP